MGHPKREFFPGEIFGKYKYVKEVDQGFYSIKKPDGTSRSARKHVFECLNCGFQSEKNQNYLTQLFKRKCDHCMEQPKGYSGSKALFCIYKESSRQRRAKLLLTLDQFREITSKNCHYCGVEPYAVCRNTEWGAYKYNGIDRVDNSIRDYVYENSVPCCYNCNISKSDQTLEEFTEHLERFIDFQLSIFQQKRD